MARVGIGTKISYRSQERRFAKSVAFPRWIAIPSILIVGFMLWLAVLADPSGNLRTPGMGSIFYVVAVVGLAALLAPTDRNGDPSREHRKYRPGFKERPNATAK